MKKFTLITFVFLAAFTSACSTASAPSGNTVSNSNSVNQANIPPEFQPKTITPSGNSTPGIPDPSTVNMNSMPKGATPTPGIPDPKEINKPRKSGATPTPGIPSPEEIKRQMNRTINNANVINQIPKNQQQQLEQTVDDAVRSVRKKQ